MSKLAASVSVRARFARSANLELDEALMKLTEHAGSQRRAQHALLAVQGERLLPDSSAERGASEVLDMLGREAGHG